MKIGIVTLLITLCAMVGPVLSYPVDNMDNCKEFRQPPKEIRGTPRSVIMGERPFLTFVTENGDEMMLLCKNGEGIQFFRENEGKKARIFFHQESVLWSDDFSGNVPGDCRSAYIFESGELID